MASVKVTASTRCPRFLLSGKQRAFQTTKNVNNALSTILGTRLAGASTYMMAVDQSNWRWCCQAEPVNVHLVAVALNSDNAFTLVYDHLITPSVVSSGPSFLPPSLPILLLVVHTGLFYQPHLLFSNWLTQLALVHALYFEPGFKGLR